MQLPILHIQTMHIIIKISAIYSTSFSFETITAIVELYYNINIPQFIMFHPQSALIVHKNMLGGRGQIDIESYIGSDEITK